MWLYVSEHEKFNDFGNEGALIWHETNMPYAVWSRESTRTLSLKYHPTEVIRVGCAISTLLFSKCIIYIMIFACFHI